MFTRKRMVVAAAATMAVLATAGTAAAAGPSKPAAAGSSKAAAVGKPAVADPDLTAAASALGITPDRLAAAIGVAKQSFAATSAPITDTAFEAAVAAQLGLPAAQVSAAIATMISRPPRTAGVKPDKKDNPANSPFATEAAAEAFAAATGISVARARSVLATLIRLSAAPNGLDPSSPSFLAVAAGLGISGDRLGDVLTQMKVSLEGR